MKRILFAHKKLPKDFPYSDYTVVRNDQNTELDHRLYSEVAGFQLFWEQLKKDMEVTMGDHVMPDDFFSLNHARRLIDRDCVNRTYVAQPMILPYSVAQHYATYHHIGDLQLCGQALKEEFPHLSQHFEQCMNGNIFLPYNIAVLTANQFLDYYNFLIKVLSNLTKKIGTSTYEERIDYIKRHSEWYTGEQKNNDPKYQARIEAFCAERLSTCYWLLVSKQMPVFPASVRLMEKGQKI